MGTKTKKVENIYTPSKTYRIDAEINEDQMKSLKESLGMTEDEIIDMFENDFYESLYGML